MNDDKATAPLFVATSRFVVADGMHDRVRTAFEQRPRRVDSVAGFVRMEVLVPDDDPREFLLVTWWTDAQSFDRWHGSEQHSASHAGIPKGLKLVSGSTEIRRWSRIAD